MTKKNLGKLPNYIIPLPNEDKKFHESWYNSRNLLNFPHPYRCVAIGPPNVGKSTSVKNILLRAYPQFEQVFVVHCDPEFTQEYKDIGDSVIMLSEIPSPEEWEGKVKTLVILDDLEFKGMNKIQKKNLDRLFGFVSTHKNISVILCSQDTFSVPTIVRRCANLWVIWRTPDIDSLALCARKTGMNSKDFHNIFNQLMESDKDSLWIDMTSKTKFPLRKNGYTLISKANDSEQDNSEQDNFKEEN